MDGNALVLLNHRTPAERSRLHAHLMPARGHLSRDALSHAPAATAERGVFVAEDEDAHLGNAGKAGNIQHPTSNIQHPMKRATTKTLAPLGVGRWVLDA